MQYTMLLAIAAFCCAVVSAGWLRQFAGDGQLSWIAHETGIAAAEGGVQTVGWTPKPTLAPGVQPTENERVLDLLLKRETTSNWTNSVTCGWMSGVSSNPWTCGDNSTCATNDHHIVACVSETLSAFYSVCLDYAAYQANSCENGALGTGCCTSTAYGACATYLWTGSPTRSMYRCANSSTIISMLDVPQFVLDASRTGSTDTDDASRLPPFTHSTGHPLRTGDVPSVVFSRIALIIAFSVIGGLITFGLVYRLVVTRRQRKRKSQDQEDQDQDQALVRDTSATQSRAHSATQDPEPYSPPQAPEIPAPQDQTPRPHTTPTHPRPRPWDPMSLRLPLPPHENDNDSFYPSTAVVFVRPSASPTSQEISQQLRDLGGPILAFEEMLPPPPAYSQLYRGGPDTPPAASSGGSTPDEDIEMGPLQQQQQPERFSRVDWMMRNRTFTIQADGEASSAEPSDSK
ncbi:hypothetical protein GGR53DRAFT_27589 [Hypoxylon sp. FL1150]|nr:hypothetical protein GGR53DRAFT_27589 [Hypoxylon sp. FL1150]